MTYRQVLRLPEFRAIVVSQGLSIVGDQISRIAVALLVYERTASAFAAAATYACSFLTWLVGGPVLSTLSDRYPRKYVMVATDLVRAALVALLVLPGVPLPAVFAVLVLVGLLAPCFESASSATLPLVLDGDRYVAGSAIMNTLSQVGQVVGFLAGGALVALISPRGALAVDAVTFVVSALVLSRALTHRPAPERAPDATMLRDVREGIVLVAGDGQLRRLLGFGLLIAFVTIAPEGLAISVAAERGDGSLVVGVLTASIPLGYVIGSVWLVRWDDARRTAALPWLLGLSGAPLLLTPLLDQSLAIAALWVVSGVGTAGQLIAASSFMRAAPEHARGRAYGVASTGLMGLQGVVLLAAGAVAEVLDPRVTVAVFALAGLALLPVLTRAHGRRPQEVVTLAR